MEVPSQLVSRCLDRQNLRAGEAAGQEADDAMTDFHQLIELDLLLQNQHFFTHALDIFCVLDRSGHILRCNAALTLLMGYRPEEVLDHHFTDFLESQKRRTKAMAQFSKLQSGQDVVTHPVR